VNQIRSGADTLYRFLLPVFVIGVVVLFFLAGVGVFGADDFDPHSATGFFVSMVGSLLLFLLALIAWRDRLTVGATGLLFVLGAIVQPSLATYEHPWVGAFHPLNGLFIFALSGWLAGRAWGAHRAMPRRTEPAPGPPPPPA
jgi:hypothetical protein